MKKCITSVFLIIGFIILLFSACRKEEKISTDTSLKLTFSTDSVLFDTVFTSLGSATKLLMIYNNNDKNLNISSISLASGSTSPFRMNVDGIPGTEIYDIEIPANDSLYVFMNVTIDPQNESLPYVIEDDIIFNTNTNEQKIKLVAWGQDAIYIVADQYVSGFPKFKIVADSLETTVWTAEKPYVVYGYALINSYGTLRIEEGTRIHFHNNSGLWSYSEGQLIVDGTFENPVIFQGDRLEMDYRDIPGQWDRIWLMEARSGAEHSINHAIIRNGFIGIQAESFLKPTEAALRINNTIIENHTGIGLYSSLYAIEAKNFVLANCGSYALALTGGGDYRFVHGTIANNWGWSTRTTPSVFFNNFFINPDETIIPSVFNFEMANSIIYGSAENEFDTEFVGEADSTYIFKNSLLRTTRPIQNSTLFVDCIFNEDPLFKDYEGFNYSPDTLSPVIGKGNIDFANEVPFDLNNVSRLPNPDMGAYQFVPGINEDRKWIR